MIAPANRYGLNKSSIDPLTKASFEKSIEILLGASVFSDSDKMRSVSSRLYTGQVFKGGTGYCELILNTNMIMNSEYYDNKNSENKNKVDSNTIANAILNINENEEEQDFFIP
jgi:DNA-directed RNA polymerase II subunit RPB1